ncbi:MAG: class I SAM-dependent DNA methyltransferase [Clostridium sp.]|nr:class I SAM-dependent DNA methyltransferase [Clostridium sp.]
MDLRGINNYNEYYTNHYFSSIFEENAAETISAWRAAAKDEEEARTPWSLLRDCGRLFSTIHDRYQRVRSDTQVWPMVKDLADSYLETLGYPAATPFIADVGEDGQVPVYLEMKKANGAPLLWVLLAHSAEREADMLSGYFFDGAAVSDDTPKIPMLTELENEDLVTKVLFSLPEPPRWLVLIGIGGIALIDRNKWNEKRYLYFDSEEIFGRREESTLQAMAVLLHKESLCPDDGNSLLDKLDDNSHRHASGVSQDLKYALREAIELLGNEVLYDMEHRQGRDLNADPVDASKLTIECLRYMYRMLFMLFIEARPELGYAPMKAQAYVEGYSLEFLRDIADDVREDVEEVGDGYYLHETLAKLYDLIYNGYPTTEEALKEAIGLESLHDVFVIEPLKAHIFDPEYTKMITSAKLRNIVMLRIIDLMSISRGTGRRGSRGRISYSTLGINQMGAVYEALLSYRGFIAEETLFEVKRAQDNFDELEVGYFIPERELDNYNDDERVRYDDGKLRKYEKGTFIYRLAGREREKSASYYTPEVLTKCLVKYALKELLEGKTADEILSLTICEPAMGSAAFLNEAINQLAEAYIDLKQKETGETISYEDRYQEIQRVKMYIADRNVYGIDLNPIAVELAEVSLWLNTIFKGGFVPWFGTQLINGNSLIGARRQVYRVEQLETNHSPDRWWENAPTCVEPGTERMPKKQVYHFLMGDPGMSSYTDKVIKALDPDGIKAIKDWNKAFVKPYSEGDIDTLLRVSGIIDKLWEKQVELQKEVEKQTADALSVFGHEEDTESSHTTIREKDLIFERLYKTEGGDNASPYARLKFAMDYWCVLWFWPIDKADLLPSRSEFLFDMSLILEGGIVSVNVMEGGVTGKHYTPGQLSLFPTEMQEQVNEIYDTYAELGKINLDELCAKNPRLAQAREIASQQHFFHWELEFAEVFAERGGFDLVLGNPPWIKVEWNEQTVLSDENPVFAVKNLTATQTTRERAAALEDRRAKALYFAEYEAMSGTQGFLNAAQNYLVLKGSAANLYKCFLPQSWSFVNQKGVSAFLHPEGIYDDPKGGELRERAYARLRYHFQFANEKKLFPEVDHHTHFSINVYGGQRMVSFDTISNLYEVNTIEQCYDDSITGDVPGIKDDNNDWNVNGHPDRVVRVGKKELSAFAKLFDGGEKWREARIPSLHSSELMEVLRRFAAQPRTLGDIKDEIFTTECWNETNSRTDGTIRDRVGFPDTPSAVVYSGPFINVANPIFQTARRVYRVNSDYDRIDLTIIPEDYLLRSKYAPNLEYNEYLRRIPTTQWGMKFNSAYYLANREMVGTTSERTLATAIMHKGVAFVHTIFGISFKNCMHMVSQAGCEASLPFDFLVKVIGKGHVNYSTKMILPVFHPRDTMPIIQRALMLNCLTKYYADLWRSCWQDTFKNELWSKEDPRLSSAQYSTLSSEWIWDTPLRTDYERRQALVEIDVLTAQALGMTLEQLMIIYRIQFPVLQSYEAETWYDQTGRIVFTNNRSLTNVGFARPEWEKIKDVSSGTFKRTFTDDTQPGGPVERTIEYVAPFDRCDREKDYETAWAFFEKKYAEER